MLVSQDALVLLRARYCEARLPFTLPPSLRPFLFPFLCRAVIPPRGPAAEVKHIASPASKIIGKVNLFPVASAQSPVLCYSHRRLDDIEGTDHVLYLCLYGMHQ